MVLGNGELDWFPTRKSAHLVMKILEHRLYPTSESGYFDLELLVLQEFKVPVPAYRGRVWLVESECRCQSLDLLNRIKQ